MGGVGVKRSAVAMAVIALGCAGRGGRGELETRRQQRAVEARALEDDLDRLEERLLASQARVRLWQEMRARHESVAAVACTNLGAHAESIALLDGKQREKSATLARKNRVAAARFDPPAGGPR